MKYLFLLTILLSSFLARSQDNNDLIVEYKLYCDTDLPLIIPTTLVVRNNVGIYQERSSKTERWAEKPTEIKIDPEKLKSNYEPYLKVDRNKKELLYFDAIGNNIFIVKDNFNNLKWDITKETKQVAGYTCTKAITKFRGREWIAWFTPEIPAPFGPWKLHGLPGLILEANDSTNRYSFVAAKIENSKSDIFDKDFATLMNVKSKVPVPVRQFMEDREEATNNSNNALSGNTNIKLEVKKVPRNGEELIYEWEQ